MNKISKIRKGIKDALIEQLEAKNAATPFFLDMVDKYMTLWDDVEEMRADLKTKGRRYVCTSVSGKEYEKENENIKLIPQYMKEMRAMLSDMKISTENIILKGQETDDEL